MRQKNSRSLCLYGRKLLHPPRKPLSYLAWLIRYEQKLGNRFHNDQRRLIYDTNTGATKGRKSAVTNSRGSNVVIPRNYFYLNIWMAQRIYRGGNNGRRRGVGIEQIAQDEKPASPLLHSHCNRTPQRIEHEATPSIDATLQLSAHGFEIRNVHISR